jgi:hypothetical protein
MTIRNIYNRRRPIIAATFIPLFLFLLELPLNAMPLYQVKPSVRNVRLEFQQEIAIINYDLIAKSGETYEVVASLVKEGDPNFRIPLKSTTGDIGEGKYAGNGRRIQWEFRKDLPKDFAGGSEYSVEVTAKLIEQGGGSWVYYVLGGALIAGGVVVLAGGKKSTSEPVSSSTPLPSTPPGRPF